MSGGWLWTLATVIGAGLLGVALGYGVLVTWNRARGPRAQPGTGGRARVHPAWAIALFAIAVAAATAMYVGTEHRTETDTQVKPQGVQRK